MNTNDEQQTTNYELRVPCAQPRILFAYKGRYQVRNAGMLEYLSAIARSAGFETCLAYDADIFGATDNIFHSGFLNRLISNPLSTSRKILKEKPALAVFLLDFNNGEWCREVAEKVSGIKKLLLNPFPGKKKYPGFDYVLKGLPEKVFREFISLYQKGEIECVPAAVIPAEAGIYDEKQLCNNRFRIKCGMTGGGGFTEEDYKNLLPDKTLFEKHINFRDSYLIYTGRGCVYECSYCEETLLKDLHGKDYCFRRSPENVISELLAAKKKYGIREVIFKDSVFTQDKLWLSGFLEMYEREINVPYKCFARAGSFDKEAAVLLKKTGCYCVEFGAQSFNEEIKRKILTRPESNKVLFTAFAVCESEDIKYDIDYMFGIPGETKEDHIMAAEIFLKLRNLNRVKCHNLVIYPESRLWKLVQRARCPDYSRDPDSCRDKVQSNELRTANHEPRTTGLLGDFFSENTEDPEMRKVNHSFRKYFKVIRLIPRWKNRMILKLKLFYLFRFVPSIFIIFMQAVAALMTGDKRFPVYLKYYPRKIAGAVRYRISNLLCHSRESGNLL